MRQSSPPLRQRAEPLPEWISEYGGDFELPEWVWRTEHVRTACESQLPPHVVWRELLFHSGLPFGDRSMALWLATYCGGAHKHAQPGQVRGNRVHCYPRAADVAARSGLSERRVLDRLRSLERAGWIIVERHRQAPSDYWLAVPDADVCPCGCESRPDELSGRPDDSSGPDLTNCHPRPDESSYALGLALGSGTRTSITSVAPSETTVTTLPSRGDQEHRQGRADQRGKTPGEVAQEIGERWAMQGRHPSGLEAALARELGQAPDAVASVVVECCRQAHRDADRRRMRVAS